MLRTFLFDLMVAAFLYALGFVSALVLVASVGIVR